MAESADHPVDKKAEAAPKKAPINTTNLLLIIVIGVLLLAVIGGGVAAVMIYRGSSHVEASVESAEEHVSDEGDDAKDAKNTKDTKKKDSKAAAKDKEVDKKDAKKEKDVPKAPAIYVSLEPPFVVNFAAGKPAKFLQITMEIMTRDPATAQILKDNNPLLRNDILMLFGAQQYETVSVQEGREALRGQTLESVRGVVKKEGGKPAEIEAVYFTSFVMQ
jgi:flagellar FliL protein